MNKFIDNAPDNLTLATYLAAKMMTTDRAAYGAFSGSQGIKNEEAKMAVRVQTRYAMMHLKALHQYKQDGAMLPIVAGGAIEMVGVYTRRIAEIGEAIRFQEKTPDEKLTLLIEAEKLADEIERITRIIEVAADGN